MKTSTNRRELISFQLQGATVRGTYHRPCGQVSGHTPGTSVTEEHIGVFFLNSLSPTRAATGDSAVYWADALAMDGYPCFRLDLPGFGDSDGDPPNELMDFINSGGYAVAASAAITELVRRFNLDGAVVVGLCAGAVSALYTACKSLECRGVVMMDPYFYLPYTRQTKLWYRIWQKLTGRIARSAFGVALAAYYHRLRLFSLPWFRRSLPHNANVPLLRCWKSVTGSGMPILVLNTAGFLRKGEFDYGAHTMKLAGRKSRVEVRTIENAGHTFSNRAGRTAVRDHMGAWLNSLFTPSTSGEDADVEALRLGQG